MKSVRLDDDVDPILPAKSPATIAMLAIAMLVSSWRRLWRISTTVSPRRAMVKMTMTKSTVIVAARRCPGGEALPPVERVACIVTPPSRVHRVSRVIANIFRPFSRQPKHCRKHCDHFPISHLSTSTFHILVRRAWPSTVHKCSRGVEVKGFHWLMARRGHHSCHSISACEAAQEACSLFDF